jgi:hypothetical protein
MRADEARDARQTLAPFGRGIPPERHADHSRRPYNAPPNNRHNNKSCGSVLRVKIGGFARLGRLSEDSILRETRVSLLGGRAERLRMILSFVPNPLRARQARIAKELPPNQVGPPLLHIFARDWVHPFRICTKTGLAPATSALGLRRPSHICTKAGLIAPKSALGLERPLLCRGISRWRLSRSLCSAERSSLITKTRHCTARL